MSDDEREMEEKSERLALRLSGYAKAALVMFFVVYLGWAVAGGIDAQFIAMNDAALSSEINAITNSMVSNPDGAKWQEACVQVMFKIAPQMHWFADAFFSGIVTCAFVGWLLGRWVDNPSWAGMLPIMYIFSGLNPACMGDGVYIERLPLEQQFYVLAGQCIAVHLVAYSVFEKRQAKDSVALVK